MSAYDPLQSDGPPPSAQSDGNDVPPPTPSKEAPAPAPAPWQVSASSPLQGAPNLSTLPHRPPLGVSGGSQWGNDTSPSRLGASSRALPEGPVVSQQPRPAVQPSLAPAVPEQRQRPLSPGEPRSPFATSSARPAVASSPPQQVREPSARRAGPEHLQIRVHGFDRTRKEVWVKMDASTNLSSYHSAHVKPFSRSFAEFVSLHSALAGSHPEAIMPALPLVQTSAATDDEEDRLVRIAFQRWVDRVCQNPDLMRDEELRLFVEANFGYTPLSNRRRAVPSGSALSKLRRTAPEENDEMGRAKAELTKLETALLDASKASEKEIASRRALAVALHAVSEQMAAFSTTENHRPLANGMRRFGEGIRRNSELINGEATAEGVTLTDGLAYEAGEAREGKETLMQRQGTVDDYRAAVKSTITKQRQVERIRGSSNIKRDKADDALDELDEAQKVEATLAQQLQAMSQKLAPSVRKHSQQLHRDLLQVLAGHGQACLNYEKQLLRDLETLQPELRSIASRNDAEVTYKHAQARSVSPSLPASPTVQRVQPVPRSASDKDSISDRASVQTNNPLSQSVIVPPTHASPTVRAPGGRINELAASVYVTGGDGRGRVGEKVADERQRVDARMAASKLANMF